MAMSARAPASVVVANAVTASFSLLGASFVLACALVASDFARGRTFVFVQRLCLADFGFALAVLFGDQGRGRDVEDPSALCVAQGVAIQVFGVAEALWAAAVSLEVRDALHQRSVASAREIRRRASAYDVQIWGLAALLGIVPIPAETYGDSGLGRCHIRRKHDAADGVAKAMRFTVYYLPIWICVLYNLYCWHDIARAIRGAAALNSTLGAESRARAATTRLMTYAKRLALYPAIQVVSNVPGTVLRLIDLFTRARSPLWLSVAHVIAKTSQGFLHGCVFVYAHPARRELVVSFARYLGLARFLPVTWGLDSRGFRSAEAQTGGIDDDELANDVDFASDDEDEFVMLSRATEVDAAVDDDEDVVTHDLRPIDVEMSTISAINDDKVSFMSSSARRSEM